jgi:hypothetical protein
VVFSVQSTEKTYKCHRLLVNYDDFSKNSDKLRGIFRILDSVSIAEKIDSETYIFHVVFDVKEYDEYEEFVVRGRNLENCGAKKSMMPFSMFGRPSPDFTYGWVLKLIGTTIVTTKGGFLRKVPLCEFVGINMELW